jgi:hypothetical protein
MATGLDTLAYAKRLREAGFTERQAEAQAEALASLMSDSLATKQDLRELELRIDARFAQVDTRFEYAERHLDTRLAELTARFHRELGDLEHRMTTKLGGLMIAGIGTVSVLVKLL